jgi:hypothetical protein
MLQLPDLRLGSHTSVGTSRSLHIARPKERRLILKLKPLLSLVQLEGSCLEENLEGFSHGEKRLYAYVTLL